MTGEIISDVMTNGFFPSTMVSGNPAAKLGYAAAQSAWQASTITGSQLAARVALPDAMIAQQHFE
jgi:hypothetical protein